MLILMLGILTVLAPLSVDLYLPVLPAMENSLRATPAMVQLTLSIFLVGLAIGQVTYGPLSDRFGRKRPLIAGLALFSLASVGCALATTINAMVALRLLQALGASAGLVIARAAIRDIVSGQELASIFSALMLVTGMAPVLAPLLGGYLFIWLGWRAIFFCLATLGLVCLCFSAASLPETCPPEERQRGGLALALSTYAQLLRDRQFLGFAFASGFVNTGMFAYMIASPHLFIANFGVRPQHYGWLFGINAAGLVIASQVNRMLLHRHSLYRIMNWGLMINMAAAITLTVLAVTGWGTLAYIAVPLFISVASVGWVTPNAAAAAMSRSQRGAGSASSLVGVLTYVAGAGAGALLSVLPSTSALSMASVMALCSLVANAAYWACVRRRADTVIS